MKDILGRTIKVGDTVVTGNHHTRGFDLITKVLQVNKRSIIVAVPALLYNHEIKDYEWHEKHKVKRDETQMLVVNEQYAYNKQHYPENFI